MRFLPVGLIVLMLSAAMFAAEPAPAAAADAPPELRGMLTAGGVRQFSLVAPGRGTSAWVKVGDNFSGWEVVDFKPANETLTIKKEGRSVALKLVDSTVVNAPASAVKATLADAEDVFRKMDFDRMMTRIVDQQKAAMSAMIRRPGATPPNVDPEALAAFQKKTMDVMFDAMDLPGMKNDMVKAYSEIFTKDELRGLSEFYGTPAGQAMVDKQPEISKRMNDVMLPRMMAVMPKIQEMGKQFQAEQAAKNAAPAPAASAPAPKP